MQKKAVVILSGGIDSTTLTYKLVNERYTVYPLTFIYGQKHRKEVEYAKRICLKLGLETNIIDISSIQSLLNGSALTDDKVEIPAAPLSNEYFETLKTTIVPNRNAILLALAVGYAQSIKCDAVFYGAHRSDRGVYPDCRKEFVEAFEKCERIANDNYNLLIEAPFVNLEKCMIVKMGNDLGLDFRDTWSCYVGEDIHCGICSSCGERKRAFLEAAVTDPTTYKKTE